MIYVDNAATTKLCPAAIRAMTACLGALPKEIYFTSGGSEADNQALLPPVRRWRYMMETRWWAAEGSEP